MARVLLDILVVAMATQAWAVNLQMDRRLPAFYEETDKVILDKLLDPKRYDRRHRPDNRTVVTASIQLFSLASPDESSLNYEVEFLLQLSWLDRRLAFGDGGRHSYLKALSHASGIWLPDIYFIKHGELKQPLVDMALKVFANGTVLHVTRRSMVINCQGNLQIFPFDNPKCPFAFESISHEMTELELQWTRPEPPLDGATSLQYHNAYLVKNETGICDIHHTWRGNYSCLRVLLVFTRDKSFYFSTVFGPGMVLVSSSFISFWLDISVVPARVMIGVTTMLNFCTTTNNFRSKLPVVSNLTAMNLWDGVCMFFIYASLLEFVVGNYMQRKRCFTTIPATQLRRRPSGGPNRSGPYIAEDAIVMQPMVKEREAENEDEDKNDDEDDDVDEEVVKEPPQRRFNDDQPAADATQPEEPKQNQDLPSSRVEPVECIVTLRRNPRSLDSVAKLVFPVVFGLFISCFFLTYAVVKPRQSENWELIGGD